MAIIPSRGLGAKWGEGGSLVLGHQGHPKQYQVACNPTEMSDASLQGINVIQFHQLVISVLCQIKFLDKPTLPHWAFFSRWQEHQSPSLLRTDGIQLPLLPAPRSLMIRMASALQVASYLLGVLFTNDLEEKQEILLPKKDSSFLAFLVITTIIAANTNRVFMLHQAFFQLLFFPYIND